MEVVVLGAMAVITMRVMVMVRGGDDCDGVLVDHHYDLR